MDNSKREHNFPLLNLQQIYDLSEYLTHEEWKYFDLSKLSLCDFSKLATSLAKEEAFTGLSKSPMHKISTQGGINIISQLKTEQVYALAEIFIKDHWQGSWFYLPKENIPLYDFERFSTSEIKKSAFDNLFGESAMNEDENLFALRESQIYSIAEYLTQENWQKLNPENIPLYDFAKLSREEREEALEGLFGDTNPKASENLARLTPAQKATLKKLKA